MDQLIQPMNISEGITRFVFICHLNAQCLQKLMAFYICVVLRLVGITRKRNCIKIFPTSQIFIASTIDSFQVLKQPTDFYSYVNIQSFEDFVKI